MPLIGFLAFIDLFVLFIPTEALIITTTLVRPKRWWMTAGFVAVTATLGALSLAWCGSHYGEPFVVWLLGKNVFESAMWIRAGDWIQHYGIWGLWFIAVGPLPQPPTILLCALGHMPMPEIAAAIFLGRLPKYLLFSFLATKGPKWFKETFGDESLDLKFTWAKAKEVIQQFSKKKPPPPSSS